jgi:hypothetical protein
MERITVLKQTPFGTSLVANVLWKELSYLQNKHRLYVLNKYNEFSRTVNQLYKHKISGREIICHLLYKNNINQVEKYLTNDSYTYFCNIMQVCMKKHKLKDKNKS